MRMVRSKVAGDSFRNRDGSDRQRIIRKFCRAGKSLEVRLEPDNRYSEDAIGLWVRGRWLFIFPARYQVGYVKEAVASQIREDVIRGSRILGPNPRGDRRRGMARNSLPWREYRNPFGFGQRCRLGKATGSSRGARSRAQAWCHRIAFTVSCPRTVGSERHLHEIPAIQPAGILRILFRGVIELVARLSALPSSHRIAAVGLVVCVVGPATWTLGFSLDETVGVFAVLRAIGV